MSDTNKYLAFAILIGGKSTRFGSDKGLFFYQGKSFISHQLETITHFQRDVFLIANSQQQVQNYINAIDYKKISAFIVDDNEIRNKLKLNSPLIGLYTAFKELQKLGYKKVFVLSCDNPLVKLEVIEYIIQQCEEFDCCIPKWNNNFLEPLLAIYPIDKAYKSTKRNLHKSIFKLTQLISPAWKTNYISIENEIRFLDKKLQSFINLNTKKDIANLELNE
ncbi:MAG: molybdenum cofactor guanylyltransferase [Promethearchaeota archaeon]